MGMSGNGPLAAIVLAAGKGTRMKSAIPKVLHPACGKPLVAWPVEAAISAGASPVVVVTGHRQDLVDAELAGRFGTKVIAAHQTEQKGTGHAAQMALPALEAFQGTVLIVYGDCPLLTAQSLVGLVEMRVRTGAPVALWTTRVADPTGYGRIVRGKDGLLEKIVEHKDATDEQRRISEINPGVYAVDAAFLRTALTKLRADNAQGELYLTDIVAIARASSSAVPTYEVGAHETMGVNDRVQLSEASEFLRANVKKSAMLNGVTFVDPKSAVVDATVTFATDVVVGPHAVITGNTTIGEGAHIGAGAVVHDTVVEAGAVVHPYSVCDSARVGVRASAGPFARLRPGAVLEEGSHVGNFVELKKTRLGRGAKANHLAYLGDSDIGAGTNIGAGTITCNYDGINKHTTTIGDDVFIGSNSTLVAPVTIGKGAYVGAGSVVTDAVPADALALGRGRQVNKEGRAVEIRKRNAAMAAKSKKK